MARSGVVSRASNGASHLNSCTLTSHVHAGGLHHHPGHPQAAQPVSQTQREDRVMVE
jgi:hypothetical protein